MRQCGLAHARQVFNQQMPSGQQAGQGQVELFFLAENDIASNA